MRKTAADKSSYDKLYCVQEEVYNRIMPKLNDVEKEELKDLNEKNGNFQEDEETPEEKNDDSEEMNDDGEGINDDAEGINDDAEEINDDVEEIMDRPPENKEEPKTDKVRLVKKSNGKWSIKKKPLKKVKNFPCKICANKSYTTKRSLQRHNNSFHVKKHSIKETEVIPEVIYPPLPPSPSPSPPPPVKSEERKSLKRKHQYYPGEFHLEKDNQQFSRDEPVAKRPKGVESEVPKRNKVKRKYQNDTNDSKKKWSWESY